MMILNLNTFIQFTFTASLLEIYNEELRDLCCNTSSSLRLGERKDGQVCLFVVRGILSHIRI